MEALKAGARAPEFELNATPDQRVKLSDFRGQRVILAFYPADWSPVCGDQLALYNELRDEFAGALFVDLNRMLIEQTA